MIRTAVLNRGVVVGIALLLALLVGVAPAASAAGGVSIDVTPGTTDVETGETTTFDVVVNSTDVGAVDFTVSLTDGSVATIESVDTPAGDSNEDISNDGQTASIAAYGLQDAGQNGSTTIATVTVSGTSAGSTALSLDDVGVSDAQGNTYDTTVDGATLTVNEQSSNGSGSSSDNDGDDDSGSSNGGGSSGGNSADDETDTSTPDNGTDVTSTSPTTDGGDTTDMESTEETTTSSTSTTSATSAMTDSEDQSTVTETQTPGFTFVLGVLALLGAGVVAARRQ